MNIRASAFVEPLEQRSLLSAVSLAHDGRLTITGTAGNDDISIRHEAPVIYKFNPTSGGMEIIRNRSQHRIHVAVNGRQWLFSDRRVKSVLIDVGDGDDALAMDGSYQIRGVEFDQSDALVVMLDTGQSLRVPTLVLGGSGDDTLTGGAKDDIIFGGDGDDWIAGSAGSDRIDGGGGDDILFGGRLSINTHQLQSVDEREDFIDGDAGRDVAYLEDADSHRNVEEVWGLLQHFTGTLYKQEIGFDGPGWYLIIAAETSVAVSLPEGQALAFRDQRVMVSGHFTEARGVETPWHKVLQIEQIQLAS